MLKGSEKQVSWAKRIRLERLATWKQSDPAVFKEVESVLKNELSASWWITYREKSLSEVLPYIQAEGGTSGKKAVAKLKTANASSPVSATINEFNNDEVYRFVGKLRSVATGELVVDPECPF
jgi:hypothetical protein